MVQCHTDECTVQTLFLAMFPKAGAQAGANRLLAKSMYKSWGNSSYKWEMTANLWCFSWAHPNFCFTLLVSLYSFWLWSEASNALKYPFFPVCHINRSSITSNKGKMGRPNLKETSRSQKKKVEKSVSSEQLLEIEHFHSNIPAVHDAMIWLC